MNKKDFLYDPVTAIDEKKATGKIAETFSDIRSTMNIPIVTSIWRGLADENDSLFKIWNLAKPIYQCGLAEKTLKKMMNDINVPLPAALAPSQLQCIHLNKSDIKNIQNIITVYNRSNGMNLMALSALVLYGPMLEKKKSLKNTGSILKDKLPELMNKEDIKPEAWTIIKHVNSLGSSSGISSHVATLWRHLAYWPSFLALVYSAFMPLQSDGKIDISLNATLNYVKNNGIKTKYNSINNININKRVLKILEGYVHTPNQVVRMVVIGHSMEKWLSNYRY